MCINVQHASIDIDLYIIQVYKTNENIVTYLFYFEYTPAALLRTLSCVVDNDKLKKVVWKLACYKRNFILLYIRRMVSRGVYWLIIGLYCPRAF
jgi:hypothetical protein